MWPEWTILVSNPNRRMGEGGLTAGYGTRFRRQGKDIPPAGGRAFCFRRRSARIGWTDPMPENEIEVAYRLRTPEAGLEGRIEALLLEQTVELPRSALKSAYVRERFVGRVINTEANADDTFLVRLGQPWEAVVGDPAQLLNVLFGNCSLQDDVELADVKAPPALARMLGGPRFGIDGWRALCGARRRALAC